ncbi:hypothetical protein LguiB_029945 [Lonicera macranthoides]
MLLGQVFSLSNKVLAKLLQITAHALTNSKAVESSFDTFGSCAQIHIYIYI